MPGRISKTATGLVLFAALAQYAYAAIDRSTLAVVINLNDPYSVETGEYYAQRRGIPDDQVIRVRMPVGRPRIDAETFEGIYATVAQDTPTRIQAYALAWQLPYRVDCMSITTAFAMGFGKRFCADGCKATAPSPYFNSKSTSPHDDYHIRPAMLLAAESTDDARNLIERGAASDGTQPQATAYLVETRDKARNTRANQFGVTRQLLTTRIPVRVLRSEGIRNKSDVMFYFTGTVRVPYLDTLRFLPGAIGDHLTSAGGRLDKDRQMSAVRWLEAGATGSYGTVVEPCNFPQKFPNPLIAMSYYLDGATLLEAYWKSVLWPGQGVFIGEPLAKPYAPKENQVATSER